MEYVPAAVPAALSVSVLNSVTKARVSLLFHGKAEELARKRAAVAKLYETHFARIARYITVRIGNISEAEDMASEVFIRALRSVESYKEMGAPMEAWLFKIAHNMVVNYHRDKSRRPSHTPLDEAFPIPATDNFVEDVERREEIEQLHQAMKELSDAQRQILALRFGGEMSSQQVAEVIGKKPGAVREMQSAAVKKLRQILKEF